MEKTQWHYNATQEQIKGQPVYYCAECDCYYLPNGREYVPSMTLPTLTGTGFTLSFEDEILANFYYTAENTEDVTEQGMLVFYRDPGEADISKADDVYTGSATDGSVFMNTTRGIAAKYMGTLAQATAMYGYYAKSYFEA